MNKLKKTTLKAKKPLKRSVEPIETISKIQYRLTPDWISLALDYSQGCSKPDLSMLHSIIKFNIRLIEALTGFEPEQILMQIWKDIQKNEKDRHKFVLDEQSNQGIKDIYKAEVETFKRYK